MIQVRELLFQRYKERGLQLRVKTGPWGAGELVGPPQAGKGRPRLLRDLQAGPWRGRGSGDWCPLTQVSAVAAHPRAGGRGLRSEHVRHRVIANV